MDKDFAFSFKSFFIFTLLFSACLFIQDSIIAKFTFNTFVPQLSVIFLIFLAFYCPSPLGLCIAFFLGLLIDFNVAHLLGPGANVFIILFVVLALLAKRLFIESNIVVIACAFFASLFFEFYYGFLLSNFNKANFALDLQLLYNALFTALLIPFGFWALKKFFLFEKPGI